MTKIDLLNNDGEVCQGIYTGAEYRHMFEWLNVDISGYVFKSDIVNNSNTLIIPFTINITDAANGKFQFELTAAQTAGLSPIDPARYDLFYHTGDSIWKPLFQGQVSITQPKTDLN